LDKLFKKDHSYLYRNCWLCDAHFENSQFVDKTLNGEHVTDILLGVICSRITKDEYTAYAKAIVGLFPGESEVTAKLSIPLKSV